MYYFSAPLLYIMCLVVACQTYEGGFGGEPNGGEAHGGYAYCALATLQLLNRVNLIDRRALRGWLTRRQQSFEGGFSGRANKLVDGCYSFWQGAGMAILNLSDSSTSSGDEGQDLKGAFLHGITTEMVFDLLEDGTEDYVIDLNPIVRANGASGGLLFDQSKLQRYILLCAQEPSGGLRDKPSKPRDFYHSCYNLSGLSVSQHVLSEDGVPVVYGHEKNVLNPSHPTLNIEVNKALKIIDHFQSKYGAPLHDKLLQEG